MKHIGYDKKTGRPEFLVEGKDDTLIDELLGKSPTASIWGYIWETREFDFTLSDIANGARISRTSLYKVLHFFEDNQYLIPAKYEKGVQYYKVNLKHPVVIKMIDLINKYMAIHIDLISAKEEIIENIYHKSKKEKYLKK